MSMTGYVELQEREFEIEKRFGYHAVKHQSFVGVSYLMKCTAPSQAIRPAPQPSMDQPSGAI
jgi:isocitrate lyase